LSRLIRAIQQAQLPGTTDYAATVAIIRNEHIRSAAKIIKNANIVEQFVEDVDSEIAQVLLVLHYAQQAGTFTEEQNDFVIGRGEKLSCLFITALVRSVGAEAICIDLADLLPPHSRHLKSPTQLGRSLYEDITRAIRNRIQQDCKHEIPIITGFFGGMPEGLLKTVGRGYSDLCAALVAVALDAEELQIWKEVDGVFNADPRKIPTAALLETISPSEAAELSFYGAEVIHPSTVEHVMRANIPIRIKNVMKPASPGTMINPIDPYTAPRVNSANEGASVGARDRNPAAKKPVAVSVKHDMLVLNVQTQDRSCSSCSFLAKVFSIVEQYNLRIDIISSSEMNVSLAMLPSDRTVAAIRGTTYGDLDDIIIKDPGLCSALDSLRRIGALDVLPNMAIVSLIGDGLKQMVGVSAEFFGVLAENNINIEMISQGKYSNIIRVDMALILD
jgi:aspartate kinase